MNTPASLVVIGLGYVGLPLALAFSREFPTTGFDTDASRIEELLASVDRNNEFTDSELIYRQTYFLLKTHLVYQMLNLLWSQFPLRLLKITCPI